MAELITMPRLSDTMTEGKVSKWHKQIGDSVKEGDILAEIETDKAVQDFESETSGTLLYIGIQEGQGAAVDSVLAIIGDKGEDFSTLLTPGTSNQSFIDNVNGNVQLINETNPGENEMIDAGEVLDSQGLPEGVEVITMPRLSDTMTDGKVAKWHKNIGDTVKEGDILAEIETDKAVQDFESEFDGTLLYVGVGEGDSAAVDSILAIIGPAGTDVSSVVQGGGKISAPAQNSTQPLTSLPSSEKNQAVETPVTVSGERIFISPLAKKLAAEKGIDSTKIKGSGEHGRIVKKDIENYQPSTSSTATSLPPSSPTPSTPSPTTPTYSAQVVQGVDSETPNSAVRTIIAKRLSESKFTAPHYYLMIEVSMDEAIASRNAINALPDTKVSFNDLVIKASALALRKNPQVNSSWAGDKIIHHGAINIGVAVAIPDGLVVPVLKNADLLSLTQISSEVKDLAGRARNKTLKANEMEGSTFSISNLGMFGIETFTSIINQPNSCILSVGAIIEKPVVKNGQIVVGNTMKLSLACDHRVVDGATGAQFLQTLKSYLENPVTMLA